MRTVLSDVLPPLQKSHEHPYMHQFQEVAVSE